MKKNIWNTQNIKKIMNLKQITQILKYRKIEKINFNINDNQLGEGTQKEKVRKNIEAIKLLHKLEDENRLANKEEQRYFIEICWLGWTTRCI